MFNGKSRKKVHTFALDFGFLPRALTQGLCLEAYADSLVPSAWSLGPGPNVLVQRTRLEKSPRDQTDKP